MKLIIILILIAAIITVVIQVIRQRQNNQTISDPIPLMKQLREKILKGSPDQFEITPMPDSKVWGAIMEIGYPKAFVTLVSLVDGNASLYISSGGGVIGGFAHPNVSQAAKNFVKVAEGHFDLMQPIKEFPYPKVNQVIFYLLTSDGVKATYTTEDESQDPTSSFYPLFVASQNVITQLRLIEEKHPPAKNKPYTQDEINTIYNLLFCDDETLFRPQSGKTPTPWQNIIFNEKPNLHEIESLANNSHEESRVRLLAYNWLKRNNLSVPQILLGVVVEVRLDDGIDTLAAYQDGSIRYLNRSGGLAVFENPSVELKEKVTDLLNVSKTAAYKIGPTQDPRKPPPEIIGNVRITFLMSDGLYFGQGPFEKMAYDPIAAPVIQRSTELLQLVIKNVGDSAKQ